MPPLNQEDAGHLIRRRHREWVEHQRRWRFLQDSYEGGNRYRYANYYPDPILSEVTTPWYRAPEQGGYGGYGGYDPDPITGKPYTIAYGQYIDTNLVPHLSEMSRDGRALYAMRLERTPVPTVFRRVIQRHLARIYSKEVQRSTPDADLRRWWEDVDGEGTPADKWFRKVVAPLLLAIGQLDLVFDHPEAPAGEPIRTRADARQFGLDRCVASYILPENLVWWRRERGTRRHAECLVFERDGGGRGPCWRHWTMDESNAYDLHGDYIKELSREHKYGICPVLRIYDERKARCEATGQSRYETVAELQRAWYNARSELILGDVLHSHPLLQGPEDFLRQDSEIPTGPGDILPKKKNQLGGMTSYEGWGYVDPPKDAQAEIRQHTLDYQDEADRETALLKPAGATTRGTVAQSGFAKMIDQQEGNDLLSEVAETLGEAELWAVKMVLHVLADGAPDPATVAATTVVYPREFDLVAPQDLADGAQQLQDVMAGAGELPETHKDIAKRLVAKNLTGMTDQRMKTLHAEIDAAVDARALRHQQALEAAPARATAGAVGLDAPDAETLDADEVGAGGAWGGPI